MTCFSKMKALTKVGSVCFRLILIKFNDQMRDRISDGGVHSTEDWPDLWTDQGETNSAIESWVDLLEFLEEGL